MLSKRSLLKFLGLTPVVAVPAIASIASEAPLTLASAKAILEKPFTVKQGFPYARCQTGDAYHVITGGGIKLEGAPMVGWCSRAEDAVRLWLEASLAYSGHHDWEKIAGFDDRKTGTLYWREGPILEGRQTADGATKWEVYSRFVITDHEEVFATEEECRTADGFYRRDPHINGQHTDFTYIDNHPGRYTLSADSG